MLFSLHLTWFNVSFILKERQKEGGINESAEIRSILSRHTSVSADETCVVFP